MPRSSDTASLIKHKKLPRRRGLGKGIGQVRGKGQAKKKGMGPG